MSDSIEVTDEERELRRALNALRLEVSGSIVDHLTGLVDAALATRKPVGDGEVVVRLTREEAQTLVGRAELALEETSWGYAALDEGVRTPLSDKLRAALASLDEQEDA